MTIGAHLNIRDGHLDEAAELEEAGYSALWVAGGQLSSLSLLADIVRATDTVEVGSSIIPVEVYDAPSVAKLYHDLEATDPGRLVVGIGGAQVPKPLRMLNSYLDELDALGVPRQARILAAQGPRKLELARDRTAGAIPLLVTPEYTADARRLLGPDATLVISQFVVLDEDPAAAREAIREPLRFLSGVAGYQANFARMGFTEADITDLSDHLVDALAVWGNEDTIAARVTEHLGAGADQVAVSVAPTPTTPDSHATLLQLAKHFH